ncbi:MAG: hypothetical protein ABI857_06485 [Acidobacteriota bacterium]
MPEDNDAKMLEQLTYAFGDLQYKYRYSTPLDRANMRPALEEAFGLYQSYRIMLLGGAVITTEQDLEEMRSIRDQIDRAATTQGLIESAINLAGFLRPLLI